MIRGTTAQFKFKLPYSKDELDWITITFWQPNNPDTSLLIKKSKNECSEPVSREICVSLSADDTAKFSDKYKARVQLRAQPHFGAVFGSKQQIVTVYPMLDDIIEEDTPIEPPSPTEEGWVILDGDSVANE